MKHEATKQALKPCPFCGWEAALMVEGDHHGEFYSLGCKNKECYGHNVEYTQTEEWMPKTKAIERWNKRQPAESRADAKNLSIELLGVITDVEQGKGFDDVCLQTIKRVYSRLGAKCAGKT